MSELIKPYEISIWEDVLTEEEIEGETYTYFKERKIADIGSNTMTGPNKAYNVVFHKNKNGEKTLSFSIKSRYYDPIVEGIVDNPFTPYLINERKVKLFYDNEWNDFIIKEQVNSDNEYEYTYTAQDAFVLELSKTGYNLEFNSELGNNQGSAAELAYETLKNTDWQVAEIDIEPSKVNEPVYKGTITNEITVKNMENNQEVKMPIDTSIFVFYSYVSNKSGKFVQFIEQGAEEEYEIDSNNNITATNYLIEEELEFRAEEVEGKQVYSFYHNGNKVIELGDLYLDHQVYRVVFKQLSTYDPVMERTVNRYASEDYSIYQYSDYVYTSSDIVVPFVTNGSNFNIYENEKIDRLQGWSKYTGNTNNPDLELVTFPKISNNALIPIEQLKQAEGYIEVNFKKTQNPNALTSDGYLFNSGFNDNARLINNIALDEEFVLRWRAATSGASKEETGTTLTSLSPNAIGAVVGFYTREKSSDGKYYNKLDTSSIIFNFYGTGQELNNKITTGTFNNDNTAYIVDGAVQEPSTRYLYYAKGSQDAYVWNGNQLKYVLKTNSNFFDYYYLTAKAKIAVTSEVLADPTTKIGIFFYIRNGEATNNYYYFQDIQITRCYRDGNSGNGNPVILGSVPAAASKTIDYYYFEPLPHTTKEQVTLYASLQALADSVNVDVKTIKPVYTNDDLVFMDINGQPVYVLARANRRSRELFYVKGYTLSKILSIEASQSNCFNILQTIAETFECWIEIDVLHNDNGAISLDDYGRPMKYVFLRRYSGKENFAGFKYGINLNSVERTIDSNEIVTKLIVSQAQSDLVDTGAVSIQNAESNIAGESHILNFDYYFNQGLLNRRSVEEEYLDYIENLKDLNSQIKRLQREKEQLSNSLTKITANRNVYVNLLEEAGNNLNEAQDIFKDRTSYTYEEYVKLTPEKQQEIGDLTEIDNILKQISIIYANAMTINNYTGLETVNEEEYKKYKLELNGLKDCNINISTTYDNSISKWVVKVILDDYVPFSFKIGEQKYSTSVNQKVLYIEVDNEEVTLNSFGYDATTETGYDLVDSSGELVSSVVVNSEIVQAIILRPKTPRPSKQEVIDNLIEQKTKQIATFENKYSQFILEGNWSSNDYISDELYYLDALNLSRVSAFPKITYNIDVVDISGIEGYELYSFNTGERTFIEDTEFFGWFEKDGIATPVQEEVIISEIDWHLDDPSQNSITIQNYKTNFEDLFQRIQATVQTVQYNETTYPKTSSFVGADGTLNESVMLDSLNKISGKRFTLTSDGSVYIDEGALVVKNLTNAANCVRINSEGIQITADGGVTWSTAISGRGINAGDVFAGSINTNDITIGSKDSPSFRWTSDGISAYKSFMDVDEESGAEYERYDFKTYVRFDEYGLYGVENGESFKAQTIQEVKEQASFGITWDGFFIKSTHEGGGQVKISKEDDIEVIDGKGNPRVKIGYLGVDGNFNNLYGINLSDVNGNSTLATDSNGDITLTGTLQSKNYVSSGGLVGWQINREGDATFNNVSVRGAIKTSVFEYAEIEAVGGAFLFRPSSTIKAAEVVEVEDSTGGAPTTYNLKVQVEKIALFNVGDWCKISNYTSDTAGEIGIEDMTNLGLSHIYPITSIAEDGTILFENVDEDLFEKRDTIVGGALISMGDSENRNNYGIGINSSDNYVNLPRRAISLFETKIVPNPVGDLSHITYDIRGILGTIPEEKINYVQTSDTEVVEGKDYYKQLSTDEYQYIENPTGNPLEQHWFEDNAVKMMSMDRVIGSYMYNTQGIYTDNIYIGDKNQYFAFYTDTGTVDNPKNEKKLVIQANEIHFSTNGQYANLSNHLSLDENGLILSAGPGSSRIQVSTEENNEGVIIYNSENHQLAKYGREAVIGDDDPQNIESRFYIRIDTEGISFRDKETDDENNEVAYINGEQLRVKNSLSFGNFIFMQRDNGHFTLKIRREV